MRLNYITTRLTSLFRRSKTKTVFQLSEDKYHLLILFYKHTLKVYEKRMETQTGSATYFSSINSLSQCSYYGPFPTYSRNGTFECRNNVSCPLSLWLPVDNLFEALCLCARCTNGPHTLVAKAVSFTETKTKTI
jgi:hypothetical protein